MSETLSLFGKQISDVVGFHAKNTSGDTITYLDTSDADAVAANILNGKTAYVNGSKITGNIPTQAAQTITPTTTDQTITSGKYLTGTQTIKGDTNLVAGNIKNGVSIFNVTGTGMTDVTLTQDYNGVIDIPKTTTDVNTIALQIKNATPNASSQSIEPDTGYFGLSKVDISGDENLVPGNIAEGVSIFGVTGTHSGGGGYEDGIIDRTISAYENSRVTTIGRYAFAGCESLTAVNFPVCTTIESYAFKSCRRLSIASFPACTVIVDSAFTSCYSLISIYLTGSSYVILTNSNAFTSTPIGGYSAFTERYGLIYVPSSMIASYQTMPNWVYFSSRFAIYDDDLPPTPPPRPDDPPRP